MTNFFCTTCFDTETIDQGGREIDCPDCTVAVKVIKGRNAGNVGVVLTRFTYGKQSLVIRGMGTVYRRSLSATSRERLAIFEAHQALRKQAEAKANEGFVRAHVVIDDDGNAQVVRD